MATFNQQTNNNNPFNTFDVGTSSDPVLADIDGDGDLDAVVGDSNGEISYFRNEGSPTNPQYTLINTSSDPFNLIDNNSRSSPTLSDINGDGELELLVGDNNGNLAYYEKVGNTYQEQTGNSNPFNGFNVGYSSAPIFADVDGDGDLDVVVGEFEGNLNYFENIGTPTSPSFTQRTGSANPFNGIDIGFRSTPTLGDVDGDGDLDMVVGDNDGTLSYFENTGSATAPSFTQQSGSNNPFNTVELGDTTKPALADVDGDGDLDVVVGEQDGTLNYFERAGTGPEAKDDAVGTIVGTILNGDVFADNGNGADTAGGGSLTVTAVNGEAEDVGQPITLDSGALLTLNADGTFAYDPNGQLTSGDTDAFTYAVSNGVSGTVTATVTVTVVEGPTSLVVNTLTDEADGEIDDDVSLRDALAIIADGGTITFANSLAGDITLTEGDLDIDRSVTIVGLGADQLTIDAQGNSRIFTIDDGNNNSDATVAISGLTLTGGNATGTGNLGAGGGIFNRENLTLTDSTLSNNSANRNGGGIFNDDASLTLTNSTVSGNLASIGGGGIYNVDNATATLTNSTVSGNSAASIGGGILNTLSANLTLTNSTVTDNSASQGGGLVNSQSTITLTSSLISGNQADTAAELFRISGNVTANGNNLFGNSGLTHAEAFEGFNPGASDIIATSTLSDGSANADATALTDILETTLQDNGGPTQTHALVAGSPAIDVGSDPDSLLFDQRGFAREVGSGVDIGAFELSLAPVIFSAATASVPENQTGAIDVNATDDADAEGSGLTYSITGGADAALFTIDSTTGIVTFITVPNFEDPADEGEDNQYNLQVSVTDSTDRTDVQDITITVTNELEIVVTTLADEDFGGGSLADELADGNGLSLREAIALAGGDPSTAATIVFAGDTLSPEATAETLLDADGNPVTGDTGTISLTNGELLIDSSLSIDGDRNNDGTADITLDVQGNNRAQRRVINVNDGDNDNEIEVSLSGLTITGGVVIGSDSRGRGGGIYNRESLAIANSTISGNFATRGGGIYNKSGTSTIVNSTISGNSAGGFGGGVFNTGSSSITNSTISGNSAGEGGGIYNTNGTSTIVNSTISGNSVRREGGGISNKNGTSTIVNSTINGNSADARGGGIWSDTNLSTQSTVITNSTIANNTARYFGGGIFNFDGQLFVNSSTISRNTAPDAGDGIASFGDPLTSTTVTNSIILSNTNSDIDFAQGSTNSFISGGTNLIGTGDATGNFDASEVVGDIDTVLDSAGLQDNGGPTQTIALVDGSPAIDAGNSSAAINLVESDVGIDLNNDGDTDDTLTQVSDLAFDQRGAGFDRIIETSVDIGAFELQSIPSIPTITLSVSPTDASEADSTTLTVTITASAAVSGNQTVALDFSGTGITPDDFDGTIPNTLTIADGQTTALVTVDIADDGLVEGSETASFAISNPSSGLALGTTTTVDVAIADNDNQTIVVDTLLDENDGDFSAGDISLREALEAVAPGGTITFANSLLTANEGSGVGVIGLDGTELAIAQSVTIDGDIDDDGTGDITLNAQGNSRVLIIDDGDIDNDIEVSLTGLTITGGSAPASGGQNSSGGGIFNRESLAIANSTIRGNSANRRGGGILNEGSTSAIANSTISGNSAGNYGGGIYNVRSTSAIANSTISGNSASLSGGGILNESSTSAIANSTISGNSAGNDGGGISNRFTTSAISNSIIAGNTASSGNEISSGGTNANNADANNLFGDSSQTNAEAFDGFNPDVSGTSDIIATSDNSSGDGGVAISDILDSTLADNGGSTLTLALVDGSPAIDAGNNNNIPADLGDQDGDGDTSEDSPFDQRGTGFTRIFNTIVDIGAFEAGPFVQGQPATIYVDDTDTVIGNAFQAGEQPYQGSLYSNTDAEFGTGASPDDVILGTSGADDIWGGSEGNDLIDAAGGNDVVGISLGDVTVDAGPGDDFVYALGTGGGTNTIELDSGTDNFWAQAGNNTITGTDDNTIGLGTGNDTVTTTGDGIDFVYSVNGGGGTNVLNLGDGDNIIWVQQGDYTITTGTGNDEINLGNGTDTVNAGDGDNIIFMADPSGTTDGDKDILTGSGEDFVQTGSGDDLIDAGAGLNTIFGANGVDTVTIRSGAFNFLGDFTLGTDLIDLDGLTLVELSFFAGSGDTAGDAFIFVGSEAIAQVADITVAELENSANFV